MTTFSGCHLLVLTCRCRFIVQAKDHKAQNEKESLMKQYFESMQVGSIHGRQRRDAARVTVGLRGL